ncbi:prepilin-type N-terminal cleavage/methylation domain-containing protein [Propionivibrio sp.]|uniref:type II secretion system protein n=1 Tax=Propionivibrio sp. TaxID=2212460 RepID=UPI002634AA45|nr:prepilin-type N-terminal cleavage/methylation domain-containing protein [Propionivibrio sp.]
MPKLTLPLKSPTRKGQSAARAKGFTLVELTIVLIIMGLLIGTLMIPLSAQIDQRNYNETRQQFSEIREALIGFALANGRLPRPATSLTDGTENPALCANDAACTGFIPWTTLGIKKTDAWNKMIRYSATPAYANAAFTLSTIGTKKIQTRDSAGTVSYLIGSASGCSPCAPAVIYSAGKNNWGVTADGTALADESTTNADEDLNASASTVFLSRNQSNVPTGGEFDDIVIWIAPYILMNRMISAGKLP